jgi:hypothetical protein
MNKDKLQIGDLVTDTVSGLHPHHGLGLVVKTDDRPEYSDTGSRVAKVYWFKLGQVQLVWLHYLTKLEAK